MIRHRRRFVFLCLALLTVLPALAAAQEPALTGLGSRMARTLIESLAENAGAAVEFTVTGSSAGIDQFCNGNVDLVATSRPISGTEAAICASNEMTHSEFALAHQIVAFAAYADAPLDCIQMDQIETLLKPSVTGHAADWTDYGADESLAMTLLGPDAETATYAIIDSLVVGDGLRRDLQAVGEESEGIELAGALAILPWSNGLAQDESLKRLNSGTSCVDATAANVEAKLYPAAGTLYLYVNRERLADNAALHAFVESAISADAAGHIEAMGFAAPSSAMTDFNATALLDPAAAGAISDGATEFTIPADLSGTVTIAGAANTYRLLESIGGQLSGRSPQFSVSLEAAGEAAGVAQLCAGEAQIAMLDSAMGDIDLSECEVSASGIDLGAHAVILLGNAADDYAACLTTAQIDTIWNASSSGVATHWNMVDAAMPVQTITLFAPLLLDRHADLLFADQAVMPPLRRDTEQDYSPLYRAAAAANVPGALTFMSWSDYGRVLDNEQERIQLVSVDAGAGCVAPNEASIGDGSYGLARPAQLLVSESALADIAVQSLLWQLFADESWGMMQNAALVGIAEADLAARRRDLETRFHLANLGAEADAPDEAAEADADSGSG